MPAAVSDPWLIERPTLLSVSGGRTSMHMLWRYLDRNDGALPHESVAVFCNTGKEHPKTLDFVQRCSTEWSCPIVWIEYVDHDEPGQRFQVVNHNSASRTGAPFAAVVKRKKFVPNQVARFCTIELKVHCSHRWARACWAHGPKRYVKALGFRADEMHRVAKARIRCGQGKDPWDLCWPLADDGVDKAAVLEWWSQQPFDLGLPDRLGNCDLCFLKARWKIAQNIAEAPELADWWIDQQDATGVLFRDPRRKNSDYRDLRRWALSDGPKPWGQAEMFGPDLLDIDCGCTD